MATASRRRAGSVTPSRRRTWGTVSAGVFLPQPAAEPDEEPLRQQGHGGVVMPAAPAPYLVVVQPQFALRLFDGPLDRPAQAEQPHQRLRRSRGDGIKNRYIFSSRAVSSARRSTTQTSGPGRPSRIATARTRATSATSGPFPPSWICATCQADGGRAAASVSTRTGAGAPGASRTQVNGCPFLPVTAGTAIGGRVTQTRTLCGTSMK